MSFSIPASHPSPSDLTKDPDIALSYKTCNPSTAPLKKLTRGLRSRGFRGSQPDLEGRVHLPRSSPSGSNNIQIFSESARGNSTASLLLGRKCPMKHYFISGYSGKLDIILWALLASGGSKPLIKASAQILHRGSSPLSKHQHTQHLFLPLNHIPFFP